MTGILRRIDGGQERTRILGYRNRGGTLDVAGQPAPPTAAPGRISCMQPRSFSQCPATLYSIERRSPQLMDMAIPVLQ